MRGDEAQRSFQGGMVFADPSRPLCVVVASTRWREPPRIRHQITRQLVRWGNVVFVELFPTEASGGPQFEKVSERLVIWRPGRLTRFSQCAVARVPLLMPAINRRFAVMLGHLLEGFSDAPKLLFNFVHSNYAVMNVPGLDDRTYVCFDEFPRMWRDATRPPALKYLLRSWLFQLYENRVARAADRCLAVHTPLRDKLVRVNPHTHLFLQATELLPSARGGGPKRTRSERPIRVAYMGYLTYNQLTDWLERVVAEDDMELWLIGPRDHKFNKEGRLAGESVHFTGSLRGAELAEKLASMDVLTMAYNPVIPEVSVQTASNKFFQYLSAGRPVVISNMRHYLEMPEGVLYRASSAEEFISCIRRAIHQDSERLQVLRRQIAAENTWDKRGEQLRGYLRAALGDRIPRLEGGDAGLRWG